jgi:hypothetical protein
MVKKILLLDGTKRDVAGTRQRAVAGSMTLARIDHAATPGTDGHRLAIDFAFKRR